MSLTKLIWQTSGSNTKTNDVCEKILDVIDNSIQEQNSKKEKRSYLGASSLGDPCSRKIQYRYMGEETDIKNHFSPKVLRIFDYYLQLLRRTAKFKSLSIIIRNLNQCSSNTHLSASSNSAEPT